MIKKRLLTALLMGGIIATGAYAQAEKGDSDDMTKKTHELNPVSNGYRYTSATEEYPVSRIGYHCQRDKACRYHRLPAGLDHDGTLALLPSERDGVLSDDERTLQQTRTDIGERTQGHGRHHR